MDAYGGSYYLFYNVLAGLTILAQNTEVSNKEKKGPSVLLPHEKRIALVWLNHKVLLAS